MITNQPSAAESSQRADRTRLVWAAIAKLAAQDDCADAFRALSLGATMTDLMVDLVFSKEPKVVAAMAHFPQFNNLTEFLRMVKAEMVVQRVAPAPASRHGSRV